MTQESSPQEKPEGERWLELIGYGHLKGQPTGYTIDGQPVLVEEFDRLCGEEGRQRARRIFTALESMEAGTPQYEQYMNVARKAFQGYLGPEVDG